MKHLIFSIFLFGFLFLIVTHEAYAYIDPGTGSYIFQLIMAGLFGVAFTVKIFWRNIRAFFSNFRKPKEGRW